VPRQRGGGDRRAAPALVQVRGERGGERHRGGAVHVWVVLLVLQIISATRCSMELLPDVAWKQNSTRCITYIACKRLVSTPLAPEMCDLLVSQNVCLQCHSLYRYVEAALEALPARAVSVRQLNPVVGLYMLNPVEP
jgi:hypothetical protein